MKITLHRSYTKTFVKRVSSSPKLTQKVTSKIQLFQSNPHDSILKDHALSGAKSGLRSFWITGDYRIVYKLLSKNEAILIDIGTHNQVY